MIIVRPQTLTIETDAVTTRLQTRTKSAIFSMIELEGVAWRNKQIMYLFYKGRLDGCYGREAVRRRRVVV